MNCGEAGFTGSLKMRREHVNTSKKGENNNKFGSIGGTAERYRIETEKKDFTCACEFK
jgi:hypothetical protein